MTEQAGKIIIDTYLKCPKHEWQFSRVTIDLSTSRFQIQCSKCQEIHTDSMIHHISGALPIQWDYDPENDEELFYDPTLQCFGCFNENCPDGIQCESKEECNIATARAHEEEIEGVEVFNLGKEFFDEVQKEPVESTPKQETLLKGQTKHFDTIFCSEKEYLLMQNGTCPICGHPKNFHVFRGHSTWCHICNKNPFAIEIYEIEHCHSSGEVNHEEKQEEVTN